MARISCLVTGDVEEMREWPNYNATLFENIKKFSNQMNHLSTLLYHRRDFKLALEFNQLHWAAGWRGGGDASVRKCSPSHIAHYTWAKRFVRFKLIIIIPIGGGRRSSKREQSLNENPAGLSNILSHSHTWFSLLSAVAATAETMAFRASAGCLPRNSHAYTSYFVLTLRMQNAHKFHIAQVLQTKYTRFRAFQQ